jgi:UDPglucose--hexose-1-phosphate uridylyltransferase
MPELRKDPVTGRWVIISTERSRRPHDFGVRPAPRKPSVCPFCPGNEDKTPPEILAFRQNGGSPNTPGWITRVVPNKFPALQIEGALDRRGEGLYDMMNGIGAHEVVIESTDHERDLPDLPLEHIHSVLWAFRERINDLKKDRRFRYILIFKNQGEAAGASLEHPHTQLIATPIIPKQIQEELEGSRRYYDIKERCVYCDIIHQETSDQIGRRLVLQNDYFIAIEPYAPRFPFETWLLPANHDASYEMGDEYLIPALAAALKETLQRLNRALNRPPYNLMLHTAPVGDEDLPYYHWHIEILPKLTQVAGFEMGSGFYINPTAPEDAAHYLREHVTTG